MANLLVIPGPITSKIIATMELVRRLRSAGHQITIMAAPENAVIQTGIDFIPIDLRLHARRAELEAGSGALTSVYRSWQRWWSRRDWRRAALVPLELVRFHEELESLSPDLILIDNENHEYVMAAAEANRPIALINTFFNVWKKPKMPPIHMSVTPGFGVSGTRAGVEAAWWRFRLWRWGKLLRSRYYDVDRFALMEDFAKDQGFPLKEEVDYFQAMLPFVYRQFPTLTLNLLELDFPHEPHATSFYVGPMTSATREEFAFSDVELSVIREVDELSQEVGASNASRKLVYCGLGAFNIHKDRDFLRNVIEAARARPQWTVLLGLGGRIPPDELGRLPANVRAYPWAPQLDILARANCALVHGGATTLYECVAQTVPMVVYPYFFDQFGNASRVQYHGLGVVGDRQRDTPGKIAERIEGVLDSTEIRSRLCAMRRHMVRYKDEARVERTVDRILAGYADGSWHWRFGETCGPTYAAKN